MTTALPHLRAIAIAGALASFALLLGTYTLNHRGGGTVADTTPTIVRHATPTTPAATSATSTPEPAATTTAPAQPAATPKPAAAPKPAGPPPVVQAAVAYGLPLPVAEQFASHPVVVVSLYSPQAAVDVLTEDEAQAGAALAGAGFATIDVGREGQSGKLTKLLGVVDAPSTLVFQAPAADAVQQFATAKAHEPKPIYPAAANQTVTPPEFKLFVTLKGYNDRQTVAQAAFNADPDPGAPTTISPWAAGANTLCSTAAGTIAAAGRVDSIAQLKKVLPVVKTAAAAYLAGLAKLPPPAGKAAAVARFRTLTAQDVALSEQLSEAVAKKQTATSAMLMVKQDAVSRQADALAMQLGATACVGGF